MPVLPKPELSWLKPEKHLPLISTPVRPSSPPPCLPQVSLPAVQHHSRAPAPTSPPFPPGAASNGEPHTRATEPGGVASSPKHSVQTIVETSENMTKDAKYEAHLKH